MTNKQTAVEWLMLELYERGYFKNPTNGNELDDLLEQAKKIHKEQTIITNEQIIKRAKEYSDSFLNSGVAMSSFTQGCNWYREQLKDKI